MITPPPLWTCPDTGNLCKVCVTGTDHPPPLECGWRHTGNVQGGVLVNVQEFRRADDVTRTMSKGGACSGVPRGGGQVGHGPRAQALEGAPAQLVGANFKSRGEFQPSKSSIWPRAPYALGGLFFLFLPKTACRFFPPGGGAPILGWGPPMQALAPGRWRPSARHWVLVNVFTPPPPFRKSCIRACPVYIVFHPSKFRPIIWNSAELKLDAIKDRLKWTLQDNWDRNFRFLSFIYPWSICIPKVDVFASLMSCARNEMDRNVPCARLRNIEILIVIYRSAMAEGERVHFLSSWTEESQSSNVSFNFDK